MGGKLTSKILTQDYPKSCLPSNEENIKLTFIQDMGFEFNKLYLNSREKLYAIAKNPSEELLHNIAHYLKQNSKSLTECFNKMDTYQYDIVDMVGERLPFYLDDYIVDDYNVPSRDYKHVDSYISSSSNYGYEHCNQQQKQQQLFNTNSSSGSSKSPENLAKKENVKIL